MIGPSSVSITSVDTLFPVTLVSVLVLPVHAPRRPVQIFTATQTLPFVGSSFLEVTAHALLALLLGQPLKQGLQVSLNK